MRYFFSDAIIGIAWFLIIVALLVGAALGLSNAYGSYQCRNYQRITGLKTRWATLDTCYVKTATGYQRWDEYRMRAATNEARAEGGAP